MKKYSEEQINEIREIIKDEDNIRNLIDKSISIVCEIDDILRKYQSDGEYPFLDYDYGYFNKYVDIIHIDYRKYWEYKEKENAKI